MANQTPFDLNVAIQTWRHNLENSPAFRRENLAELESHLRDSVATLQGRGLSEAEAFLIATRRIGEGQQLAAEYGKVNRNTIWFERAMWMLIGIQVWAVASGLFEALAGNAFFFGWKTLRSNWNENAVALPATLYVIVQLLAFLAAGWTSWVILRNAGRFGVWISEKLRQRSSFIVCCIFASVGVLLVYVLRAGLQVVFNHSSPLGAREFARYLFYSSLIVAPLRIIVPAVLTVIVARKRLILEKA